VLHLIRSPQLVAETIRAVRAETPDTPEAAIIAVIDQFWPLWEELFPAERARVIRPDQPSAFSRCMLRFTTRSTFNATSSPAAPFDFSGPRQGKHGRLRPLRPERACQPGRCDFAPVLVTVPSR
jgi:hypothetical protein